MTMNRGTQVFLLMGLVMACLLFSAYSQADNVIPSTSFDSQLSEDNSLSVIEKENRRCIRCHQKKRLLKEIDAITSVGAHASDHYYNNCSACHGNKGQHPKDNVPTDLVPFDDHADMPIYTQNKRCIACHSPTDLRASEWTHDVHVSKMTCSNCHRLHQETDPFMGISKSFRIGLCATCHEDIQRDKRAKKNQQ